MLLVGPSVVIDIGKEGEGHQKQEERKYTVWPVEEVGNYRLLMVHIDMHEVYFHKTPDYAKMQQPFRPKVKRVK